jgi:hypothetical protein
MHLHFNIDNLLFSLHYPFLDIFWRRYILHSLVQTSTVLHINVLFNEQGMRRKRAAINPTLHMCAFMFRKIILGWEISIADLAIMRRVGIVAVVVVVRTDIIFISLIVRLFVRIQMSLKIVTFFFTRRFWDKFTCS